MKMVMPYQNGAIAGHFSKSAQYLFLNGDAQTVIDNPAGTGGLCSGKKQLLQLFQDAEIEAVVVRNIGQNMMQSLFAANIRVFRLKERMVAPTAVTLDKLEELTCVSQGRPSKQVNKAMKQPIQKSRQTVSRLSPKDASARQSSPLLSTSMRTTPLRAAAPLSGLNSAKGAMRKTTPVTSFTKTASHSAPSAQTAPSMPMQKPGATMTLKGFNLNKPVKKGEH
uniref:NifB/NifX family molybdenum-iron cluster-binding protein n=1 Tax=Thaumasiovibrio occultus TaxID=1891184 RepID=UPI000B34F76A|nr:NifB/NifX family molybdenum-iron cluster-binding protein [Thaumasiovibrio occultus]